MKLPDQDAIAVTAAPSAFANVGGYRFAMRDLQHAIGMIDEDSLIAALPHSLTGHRLAGHAADPVALRARLRDFGVNPLVSGAFRDEPPILSNSRAGVDWTLMTEVYRYSPLTLAD